MNIHEKYLYDIADFLISNNKPITFDYTAKYSLAEADYTESLSNNNIPLTQTQNAQNQAKDQSEQVHNEIAATVVNDASPKDFEIYELLKKYRLDISKQENLKAYMVFNNEVLDSLVKIKPKNKEELIQIKGFGEKKVEKYGDEILKIINR